MGSTSINADKNTVLFAVLRKVAEKENCDELDLPPLYNSIDPAALNSLALSNIVQFEYCGYKITVENGIVTMDQ